MRALARLRRRQPRSQPRAPLPAEIEAIRQQAEKGHTLEQVLWGKILLNSVYVPSDPEAARTWFTIAANAQYGPGHNMLGRCFHFGWGCRQDFQQAARCYARAAELGDEWGRYNLGILTMRGLGVTQDLATALACFRQAAHAGHAKSMNLYARFLEEGWTIPRDRQAALSWYRRSAEGGDYRGQHNYATFLLEAGKPDQALHLWEQAARTATPDILQAMARTLAGMDRPEAATLRETVETRLKAIL
ncbi:Sel1 domain protein repeat-containing protein [Gluconacetobacter diazotrophicus PA1 5]|uniref:tetratricopeptide repeat protein n=1 Tax=Gluconacetobacter diazotrophicus TaxID=33996 RepID=UPI000173B034|nr:Sel1 domain protein repeat-containing protein [Gluconacetobacter diazotrophicus PA1 5]TWB11054.1 hypothetical protein FBZ86_10180 [Gluconacetobacter diazotrophicus]